MLTLGEAYAFGVVWSFVFMSLSMLVLRFKRPEPREYEVPLNIRVGRFDLPVGMTLDLPGAGRRGGRQPADQGGGDDHRRGLHGGLLRRLLGERARAPPPPGRRRASTHEHLEQFNQEQSEQLSVESLQPDQAVSQAGGDPLAVQPGDARAVPGRDRSRDDRRRRDDGVGAAARARAT